MSTDNSVLFLRLLPSLLVSFSSNGMAWTYQLHDITSCVRVKRYILCMFGGDAYREVNCVYSDLCVLLCIPLYLVGVVCVPCVKMLNWILCVVFMQVYARGWKTERDRAKRKSMWMCIAVRDMVRLPDMRRHRTLNNQSMEKWSLSLSLSIHPICSHASAARSLYSLFNDVEQNLCTD